MTNIVLAHGIARPDILFHQAGKDIYFKGIAQHLHDHGFSVKETSVDWAASVEVRWRQLAEQIRPLGAVHVIGHSMGGLDARHMIVNDAAAAAGVKSLTTIGTPHCGTSFADFGLHHGGDDFVEVVTGATRLSLEGFRDLATDACHRFNESAREAESSNHVKYRVVSASESFATTVAPLQFSHGVIRVHEGENDGLVSVASQRWNAAGMVGTKRIRQIGFPLPADHLNEIGWWDPAEAAALLGPRVLPDLYETRVRNFYLEMAQLAAAEG